MTPDQAKQAVEEFMGRTMQGSDKLNLQVVPWRTREFENAYIFSIASFDPETGRPAAMQPGGINPIIVTKDGRRVAGFWPFDPELAEYGMMSPRVDHVVVLSSVTDVAATARALRDVDGMSLPEALRKAREIAAATPHEIPVPDAAAGKRLVSTFLARGAACVHEERCETVRRTYLGRPWPMPDWMPKMLDRIRLRCDLIDRYLDGTIDLLAFKTEFVALDHGLSDAEWTEAEMIEATARREWRSIREELYIAVLEAALLCDPEEMWLERDADPEKEPSFRDRMRETRTALDDLVARHAMTPERPTPLAEREAFVPDEDL